MLVRSGVTNIRVIDFDQVTLSSLNRHAMATLGDGQAQGRSDEATYTRGGSVVRVDSIVEMFKGSEHIGSCKASIVLDCIDDVTTKAELIAYCLKNDLCNHLMGAGKATPQGPRIL